MIRLSQVVGQRVLARANGQLLGSVRRLQLDAARGEINAVQLERAEGGDALLDWSSVVGVGPDALMVEDATAARDPDRERHGRLLAGELDLLGKQVLTEDGNSLGQLEDLEFDERSGRISHVLVPGHALPAVFVSLGRDALIVAASQAISAVAAR